jgi:glycine oxidase
LASFPPDTTDVVVIGGGLIGCAIAFELAGLGRQVTVLDQSLPARAASWAGAGMLSPLGHRTKKPALEALMRASRAAYPTLLERILESTGSAVEFGAPGKIEVAFAPQEAARLETLRKEAGVHALSPAEALHLEPALNPAIIAASHFPEDAFVDNRTLGEALWHAAAHRGVVFRLGDPALSLRTTRNRVTSVQLANSRIAARSIVIAAGAWSARIDGMPRPLPVVPVRGQMIALHWMPQKLHSMLESERCYLIPRAGGRVLVGATIEHVGFDPRTSAAGIQALLGGALELVPALAEADVREVWTGFRPGTPDDLPILGADPDIEGLFYATGHYRNGILLAPITGTVIAELIEGRKPSFVLADFRPDRFRQKEGMYVDVYGD